MKRFILKRALDSVIALLGLLVVVFFLTRLTGDPVSLYLPEDASVQMRGEFAERHGYNDPAIVQFARYVWGVFHLDFGTSLRQQRPAIEVVLDGLPTTAILASVCIGLTVLLALVFGSLAARKPMGAFDRLATSISLLGSSAPDFWIAIVGILVFAVMLQWLPTSGMGGIEYWIMPVIVVLLRPMALLTQVVRGTMISVLSSPYVKTARGKGLPERTILVGHALRSSLLPIITVAGDLAIGMINGSIIVETVFGLHGIGKITIDAILQRDFAVVQCTVLVVAILIFVFNILIDLLYALVDPRIRHN